MTKSIAPTYTQVAEVLAEQRTEEFKLFLDYCEENDIDLNSPDWRRISEFATKEDGINLSHATTDLSNLQVEKLTAYEWGRILKRARTAVKRIKEQNTKWSGIFKKNPDGTFALDSQGEKIRIGTAGPYHTNRKQRRALMRRIIKHSRSSQRPMSASAVIRRIKENKSGFQSVITTGA